MKRLLIIPLIILFTVGISWASIPHRPATPEDGHSIGPQRPTQPAGVEGMGGYFEEDTGKVIEVSPDYDVTVIDLDGDDEAYNGWDFGDGFFSQDFFAEFYLTVNSGDANMYCYISLFSASLDEAGALDGADDGQGVSLFIAAGATTYELRIHDMEIDSSSNKITLDMGITYIVYFYRDWDTQILYLDVYGKFFEDHETLTGASQSPYRYFYFVNSFAHHEPTDEISAELIGWWIEPELPF